jgi:hypothetical protein
MFSTGGNFRHFHPWPLPSTATLSPLRWVGGAACLALGSHGMCHLPACSTPPASSRVHAGLYLGGCPGGPADLPPGPAPALLDVTCEMVRPKGVKVRPKGVKVPAYKVLRSWETQGECAAGGWQCGLLAACVYGWRTIRAARLALPVEWTSLELAAPVPVDRVSWRVLYMFLPLQHGYAQRQAAVKCSLGRWAS